MIETATEGPSSMYEQKKKRDIKFNVPTLSIICWIFTIGLCQLSFWQGVFAFLIWPYYIGVFVLQILQKYGVV
jgi:hypothetical protein